MTPEEWAQVKDIVAHALQLDETSRARYVSTLAGVPEVVSGEVRRLLREIEETQVLYPPTAPVSRADVLTGETLIGRFKVGEHLGSGAMGDVYSAYDLRLKEMVAFKTLRPHLAQQPELAAGLEREVHLARRVRHPNVCHLFDLHHDATRPAGPLLFFTMELLPGETLAACVRRAPLGLETALTITRQLAHGLAAIHEAGLVHRDLKPGNVFLLTAENSLRVVITDFGLCFEERRPVTETISMFGQEAIIGTPAYMAPEQLLGKGATRSSDVYALGVLLFEVLTGTLPFEGETPLAIAFHRLQDKPKSLTKTAAHVPPRWERTILQCLEFSAAKRPESPQAVVALLTGEAPLRLRLPLRREWLYVAGATATAGVAMKYASVRKQTHTPNAQAVYHFQLGLEYGRQVSPAGIRNAIREYQQAVSIDGQYAEGWANLAEAYCLASTYSVLKTAEARGLAEQAAQRALGLDAKVARAHAAYAYALSTDLRRWRSAEASFQDAIRLDARDPSVRSWYAGFLGRAGRPTEAVQMAQSALQLDPGSLLLNYRLGTELLRARRFPEALAHAQNVVLLHPAEVLAFCLLARAHEWLKNFKDAELALQSADRLPQAPVSTGYWATLRAAENQIPEAERLTAQVRDSWRAKHEETNVLLSALGAIGMAARVPGTVAQIVFALREGISREDETVLAAASNPYLQWAKRDEQVFTLLRQLQLV